MGEWGTVVGTVCVHDASYSCSLALQSDFLHSPLTYRDESSWQRLPLKSPNALVWIRLHRGCLFSQFSLAYSSGSICSRSPSRGWESCKNDFGEHGKCLALSENIVEYSLSRPRGCMDKTKRTRAASRDKHMQCFIVHHTQVSRYVQGFSGILSTM